MVLTISVFFDVASKSVPDLLQLLRRRFSFDNHIEANRSGECVALNETYETMRTRR